MMQPIIDQIIGEMHLQYENGVMKAVQDSGFNVNKERLLQALTDARAFYDEGFSDGLREQQKWIPVTERMPEDDVRVLALHDDGVVRIGISKGYFPSAVGRNNGKDFGITNVTHWMPLPEPLEEERAMTCKDCKFYENECESHAQMRLLGKERGMEICECFCKTYVDCWECINFDECHYSGFLTGRLTSCPDYKQKLKTNADRIRAMSDEELGIFLGEWAEKPWSWKRDGEGECLVWLKEPAKEGE